VKFTVAIPLEFVLEVRLKEAPAEVVTPKVTNKPCTGVWLEVVNAFRTTTFPGPNASLGMSGPFPLYGSFCVNKSMLALRAFELDTSRFTSVKRTTVTIAIVTIDLEDFGRIDLQAFR